MIYNLSQIEKYDIIETFQKLNKKLQFGSKFVHYSTINT